MESAPAFFLEDKILLITTNMASIAIDCFNYLQKLKFFFKHFSSVMFLTIFLTILDSLIYCVSFYLIKD